MALGTRKRSSDGGLARPPMPASALRPPYGATNRTAHRTPAGLVVPRAEEVWTNKVWELEAMICDCK